MIGVGWWMTDDRWVESGWSFKQRANSLQGGTYVHVCIKEKPCRSTVYVSLYTIPWAILLYSSLLHKD